MHILNCHIHIHAQVHASVTKLLCQHASVTNPIHAQVAYICNKTAVLVCICNNPVHAQVACICNKTGDCWEWINWCIPWLLAVCCVDLLNCQWSCQHFGRKLTFNNDREQMGCIYNLICIPTATHLISLISTERVVLGGKGVVLRKNSCHRNLIWGEHHLETDDFIHWLKQKTL